MKNVLKRIQNKELSTETSIYERFIAGAFAGFISQTVIYPLDVSNIDCFYFFISLYFDAGLKSAFVFKTNW